MAVQDVYQVLIHVFAGSVFTMVIAPPSSQMIDWSWSAMVCKHYGVGKISSVAMLLSIYALVSLLADNSNSSQLCYFSI